MKSSKLITLLQDAIDKYGDLPVHVNDTQRGLDFDPVVDVLDNEGYSPEQKDYFKEPYEIWITCDIEYT